MKHLDSHTPITQSHEATIEDARPLRLDRQALRLDPPVVRFSEPHVTDSHAR